MPYRLAVQRGEVADGVLGQSPFAQKLADPELVRAYVAEVMQVAEAVGRERGVER
jgi:hypothetical protein